MNKLKQPLVFIEPFGKGNLVCFALTQESQTLFSCATDPPYFLSLSPSFAPPSCPFGIDLACTHPRQLGSSSTSLACSNNQEERL